ncbi:penicillin-binding protein PbpB [Arthrobacter sp. Hiyo1]|nr:penicillin-binding protein PbpB [Arthrobacter sp. Hiyo1]
MVQKTGKSKNKRTPAAKKRLRLGLGIMLTLLLVVGGKLFLVQGLDVGGMAEAAYNNRLTTTVLPAERGKILDANGTVLASSVIRYNIVVDQTVNTNTSEFSRYNTQTQAIDTISRTQGIAELSSALGMDVNQVTQAVTGDKKYNIVAKEVKPDLEDRISQLHIPGIVSEGISKRVYPNGSVAGGIIGFLKDGTTGQAGLEQTQDDLLRGKDGKRVFEIGADGSVSPWQPIC